jgi:DNA replication protein DnaC
MSKNEDKSTVLLKHHLKALKMPTILSECEKVAARCAKENMDHLGFLLQLCELELLDRERRAAERRLKAAKFPRPKTLETFDFKARPSVNKPLVRPKPTAYGRATLGAKPFRRAPFRFGVEAA